MVQRRFVIAALASCLAVVTADIGNFLTPQANAQSPTNRNVIVAMTTSIEDSGLLDDLVPAFEKTTGYRLKKVAVGTGQALALAEKGEVDMLFVNSPKAERKVLQGGAVTNRRLVMHNDFVIVGPGNPDKAKIRGSKNVVQAFNAIAKNQALFVSRGDDSGTNKLEKDLWQQANINPAGSWYQQTGSGMARTLQVANQKLGYTLADRATYLFQKKNLDSLQVLVEGDRKLLNLYHVMQVNPQKFPRVNSAGAKAFIDFVLSPEGQRIIAAHGRKELGQPLFFADGGKSEKDYGF
ncbi:tungstate ABC transporter permease [Trichormus variabilis ATCC 29413]|uniref:Tungstate ABC transporter permease n=2 Tax=Anabaena variabilis TaxID=264691 RepID=Q3M5U1_TRIV2|nr:MULTISPECIES: substrate-binding domain-containing protein [Nostocaceae]ABA23645.1 tungstate ABC transporter permease [Trichormus variabilis ATCC 29413]MBC1214962.1 substrate-binding domain-containing protein [Trichormus variabilis ARAD]MBC1254738.1 substrate-binding domain-containing protein [Trichormus variabilis V5]MBC1266089.1 substrate-binding domain-containing protein [Trichormus variabilis FSR]MBC1303486.1 substrate-binding domain-containing protein [Trichormus variabilis N2B]